MTARIDSHLHVWELARGGYDWLTPVSGALYADFTAEAAAASLATRAIDRAVLVQAQDSRPETDYLLSLASLHPWVLGVVGWVDLDHPAVARRQLTESAAHPQFVGVRTLLHTDPRTDLLERPAVRESLRAVAAHGLPFDVPDAWPRHLPQLPGLAAGIPELTVVINHLGKPPRGRAELLAWRDTLALVAARPNVVAKVSGLRTPGANYSAATLAEIWEIALDLFGADRLMWGSDWPMPIADGDYAAAVDPPFELIDTLSVHEQTAILSGTAARVYSPADSARKPA